MSSKKLFDRIDSVRLENITKTYGEQFAVKNLNLEVQGGELLILIGRSGSGKTTAMRTINRLTEPDSGTVFINGTDVREFDPVRLRRNIGYVIQNIGLLPHFRISENIGLLLKLEGWKEGEIRERVRDLLNLVSLPPENFMDRYPHELSGGQQQRVGLARAMALNPPLFLMDEPFGALDPLLRTQLQDEFCKIKKELGRTIVFVTHDINEAFRLGDRIAVMNSAELVQIGTPEELIFSPASDLVAEIVDSKRKYRHIDALKVGDMMQPLAREYILDPGLSAENALDIMVRKGLEVALVTGKPDTLGRVGLNDILKARAEGKGTEEAAKPLPFFSFDTPLLEALAKLKSEGESMGLVFEANEPVGILFSDQVVQSLI
ncbi:L-proline glycine betaine ABC transport system permease protein ProV [Methanosarcina horonobensis HB-1 = JCM 15518]|uniref:Molybdate/tungstate import ATP-binding protein WtpC n=1 Tax=Methanosarcina horonobensis HB-1 = JCM 15518 TaxID=1434110 RepID=A0A0E3SDY9_9EURY|nr:betaine/proline/choline family ABC transporter ATP-binding protein [Methanosarcina horonobensis]AKB77678.1 L-proline glycine betaine ABC transport system permease protein ProV [Methanosarcina horonobensis HB-1 = JCM 15518]